MIVLISNYSSCESVEVLMSNLHLFIVVERVELLALDTQSSLSIFCLHCRIACSPVRIAVQGIVCLGYFELVRLNSSSIWLVCRVI